MSVSGPLLPAAFLSSKVGYQSADGRLLTKSFSLEGASFRIWQFLPISFLREQLRYLLSWIPSILKKKII